jgi:mRNA-degrading endonuclease HigB of HigAB toxin-antitoxin module
MIDNTSFLEKLCIFNEDESYYKFSAILRKKDCDQKELLFKFSSKKEILLKDWMVENKDQMDKALHDMKTFCDVFPCRIYLSLDRKNKKKTLIQMRNKVDSYLDVYMSTEEKPYISIKSISKLVSSSTSIAESSDKNDKRWLFDINTDDLGVIRSIEYICDTDHIATLKTVNGYHVVANKTFSPNDRGLYKIQKQIGENVVELKSNAMTLIMKK